MTNPDVDMTLDDAVAEVLGILTGQPLTYMPEEDRYYAVTRAINQALRSVGTVIEWSYYSSTEDVGLARAGQRTVQLRATVRPRIINDDSVRLVRVEDDYPITWAYWLPRDAINKVPDRQQLWVSHTRSELIFSRPFTTREDGLKILVPVMREPKMFRLPPRPINPEDPIPPVPDDVREQLVDFGTPDLVIAKAAYFYAQSDPVLQPRVQTLEANADDLMYALRDRDQRNTDSPFMNTYHVPVDNDINGSQWASHQPHSESWNW